MDNSLPVRGLRDVLAERLRQLRQERHLTAGQLGDLLPAPFRPARASPGGIGYKLEQGRREIDDVLLVLALAVALGVSPLVLLLPASGDEPISLFPDRPPVLARDLYAWLIGAAPLPRASDPPEGDQLYLVARGALHLHLPYINTITTRVAGIDIDSQETYKLIQRMNETRRDDQ